MPDPVAAARRFSRFYTRRIGLLHEGFLGSRLSLAEGRIIYELAQSAPRTASSLANDLSLDPGYLSRILKALEAGGLISRIPSETDARQNLLDLTESGRQAFGEINARSQSEIAALLGNLSSEDKRRLVAAFETVEVLLDGKPQRASGRPVIFRSHRPGDMGWVTHRQAVLYAQEYGWDERFEALVAEITAQFIQRFNPARERCWIAERDGVIIGSVFLVRHCDAVAKLRLLYVEPEARGVGLGRALVDECINFARLTGYQRMILWTNDVLAAARRIYQQAGFRLTASEPHHSFGRDLVGETWELDLGAKVPDGL